MRPTGLALVSLALTALACNQDALPAVDDGGGPVSDMIVDAAAPAFPGPLACPAPDEAKAGNIDVAPTGLAAAFRFGGPASAPCGCRTLVLQGGIVDMSALPDGFIVAPQAGTITASSINTVGTTPDTHGEYGTAPAQTVPIFSAPGKPLTVTASGGDIPAFSTTLTTPADAIVTSPALPASGPLVVDAKQGLALAWQPFDGLVEVETTDRGFEDYEVTRCTYDGRAGGGHVAAWGAPSSAYASVAVSTAAATVVPAGAWDVLVDAHRAATTPAGQPYSAFVTFK